MKIIRISQWFTSYMFIRKKNYSFIVYHNPIHVNNILIRIYLFALLLFYVAYIFVLLFLMLSVVQCNNVHN